jgi:hypothetical protein
MKQLKIIGLSLALFLGACSSGAAELEKLKDEACACKDKACATAVAKKLEKAMDSIKEPSNQKDAEKMLGAALGASACLAKHGAD